MRKNERPHKLKLVLHKQKREMLDIPFYICSCKVGQGFCNCMLAFLHILGHYIKLGFLGASPDYIVYDSSEPISPNGLHGIKCPSCGSSYDVKFLKYFKDGTLSLNRNGEYCIQTMGQLGLTGLNWCDYLVWCENDFNWKEFISHKTYFKTILRNFNLKFRLQIWFTQNGNNMAEMKEIIYCDKMLLA